MTRFKAESPSESQIQSALFSWIRILAGQDERYANIYSVPNGGYGLPIHIAARLKREGLEPGVPDIIIDVACHGYHGFRIEQKKPGGSISSDQRKWKIRLERQGYAHAYSYSQEASRSLIELYFGISPQKFAGALCAFGCAAKDRPRTLIPLVKGNFPLFE